jgi:hypothetical protein
LQALLELIDFLYRQTGEFRQDKISKTRQRKGKDKYKYKEGKRGQGTEQNGTTEWRVREGKRRHDNDKHKNNGGDKVDRQTWLIILFTYCILFMHCSDENKTKRQ